ncbi:MAG TPA: TMEM175 family protein [Egibacteraceae bacterium]|nr:TMEM175 family protein [Egibacteraceae bacterium]
MTSSDVISEDHRAAAERESLEFSRVVNLSDAVFAIALTLLVLNLEVPRVPAGELASALADQTSAFIAFALAFFLVANIWWQHHRIFAVLGFLEPGLVAINMAILAGVALAPFPTSLVGVGPNERTAVMSFIGLFAVLTLVWLSLILRAQAVGAWRRPLPRRLLKWLLGAGWPVPPPWGSRLLSPSGHRSADSWYSRADRVSLP